MPSMLFPLSVLVVAAGVLASAGAVAAETKVPDHAIVTGFERFFDFPKANAVKGGQLLLGELNCTSCHEAAKGLDGYVNRKQAPILDGIGSRARRSFVRKFLTDPAAVKPGSTMPKVFADLPEQERGERIEALVHFLATTGALANARPNAKGVADGRTLYHHVGCVACHGTRDAKGDAAKVLPTSVPLGDLKGKYSIPSLTAFLLNPHAVRPAGRMPGILANNEAGSVASYLLQGIAIPTRMTNLTYAYYEGSWQNLPDFATLKPKATGKSSGFDLGAAPRLNEMAMRFEGYLNVAQDGDYRFHLTSDDGSKLFIDDKAVVVNDGVHPPSTASGSAKLTKGTHKFVAGVFNAGGGVELHVEVEGPGIGRQDVNSFVTLTPEGNPKVEVPPELKADDFPIQPALVEKGRELFASSGCASCHRLTLAKKVVESSLKAAALAALKPEAGCLAATPPKGAPRYALSAAQRSALAAALTAPVPAAKPEPPEVITRTFVTFNCYGCHVRDQVGGPEPGVDAFFETTQKEMGEEGRLPPWLDGVGGKLTHAYLQKILANGSRDRPYVHTRMPRFGADNVGYLTAAFEAVDKFAPTPKVTFTEAPQKVKATGRHLVGATLGCIKCHTFAGHKAEGVQGIDMTIMTQRLQRDWFFRYLLDPQKVRPGTRMPAAWPNGQSMLDKVFGGSTAQQIESIWVYLGDGGKAALPAGLNKQSIPLVPDKEAIIYRNFIAGAGPRAIAVGYPEKAHLAFDANNLRLALIWQGDFIDAALHWTDRGVGYQGPLGDNVVTLPAGVSFAVLAKPDEAWPIKPAQELDSQFKGYRLTKDERPTFLYSVHGVKVEDFPNAVAAGAKTLPSIRRTLTLSAEKPVDGLYFRAAQADKIESAGEGWFKINGEWKTKIESAATPTIRKSGNKMELLVPVRFEAGRATIVQEFVW